YLIAISRKALRALWLTALALLHRDADQLYESSDNAQDQAHDVNPVRVQPAIERGTDQPPNYRCCRECDGQLGVVSHLYPLGFLVGILPARRLTKGGHFVSPGTAASFLTWYVSISSRIRKASRLRWT